MQRGETYNTGALTRWRCVEGVLQSEKAAEGPAPAPQVNSTSLGMGQKQSLKIQRQEAVYKKYGHPPRSLGRRGSLSRGMAECRANNVEVSRRKGDWWRESVDLRDESSAEGRGLGLTQEDRSPFFQD